MIWGIRLVARRLGVLLVAPAALGLFFLAAAAWAVGAAFGNPLLRDVGDNVCKTHVTLACLLAGTAGGSAGAGGAAGGSGTPAKGPGATSGGGKPAAKPPSPGGHPDPQAAINDPHFVETQGQYIKDHPEVVPTTPTGTGSSRSGDLILNVVKGIRGSTTGEGH